MCVKILNFNHPVTEKMYANSLYKRIV